MLDSKPTRSIEPRAPDRRIDVSIVMPCLDEALSLRHCVANAREALERIERRHGIAGEVVVADNGSTDGSQRLAAELGARVVHVPGKGYGAALIGGCAAARGRFLVMGDADGSYDFTDGVAMVGALLQGADLCMGSRFRGGIAPGAMPWKNRYIGNPALTGILNLFFRAGVEDAHCGLRAITRDAFLGLRLRSTGMEFASEMVIKAALKGLRIAEAPATLSADLRERPPHLRPWRDGWRHLRYLLMLSPSGLFFVPALVLGVLSAALLALLAAYPDATMVRVGPLRFGDHWAVLCGAILTVCAQMALFGVAATLHGIREGFRKATPGLRRLFRCLRLENMLLAGVALCLAGCGMVLWIADVWSATGFGELARLRQLAAAMVLVVLGLQTIFGGFFLAIVCGNDADLSALEPERAESRPRRNGLARAAVDHRPPA